MVKAFGGSPRIQKVQIKGPIATTGRVGNPSIMTAAEITAT